MLRLLIPVVDQEGAAEASRYAAFLWLEHCVADVEVLEVLEPIDEGRAAAFHSRGTLRRHEKHVMLDALVRTREILDDARVPYQCHRVFGHGAKAIGEYARRAHSDVVLIDASRLNALRRYAMLAGLRRYTHTPVTMLG